MHDPCVYFTLAQSAKQAFEYVLPFSPQTGIHNWTQIQFKVLGVLMEFVRSADLWAETISFRTLRSAHDCTKKLSGNNIKMKRVFLFIKSVNLFWWLGAESNCPPMGYESIALTNWATKPKKVWLILISKGLVCQEFL